MAPVVLTDVSKIHRGGAEAVRGVSFSVPDGACCAIVGPVGSGKSTLLRLIANLEPLTSGVIEVGETVSQSWRIGPQGVAELHDARAFDRGRNVYDNMAAGPRPHGVRRKQAEAATLGAADRFALGPLMARKTATVSSGEAALAALGRGFARRPEVLLLDDPFVRLDPARRLDARRALKALQRGEKRTVLIATHDLDDALALADMLVILDGGRLVAAGDPRELYDRPATADLARALGAPPMNVLPVRGNQTGLSLEDGTHFGAASVMTTATFALLGVRPEALFVAGEGAPPAAAAIFPVQVETVERAAHETYLAGRVGPHPFEARLSGMVEPPSSGLMKLGAVRENLHMFDAGTGARI